jgi:hypothetical protein
MEIHLQLLSDKLIEDLHEHLYEYHDTDFSEENQTMSDDSDNDQEHVDYVMSSSSNLKSSTSTKNIEQLLGNSYVEVGGVKDDLKLNPERNSRKFMDLILVSLRNYYNFGGYIC